MSAEAFSTRASDFGASPFLRQSRAVGHAVATIFVVMVLLTAAGLKVYSSLASSADGHRSIPMTIALGEILLSILLLVKPTRNIAWVAAGCLFAMFATFNTYQAFQGLIDCGCFGALNLSPTTVLAIDLVALALITAFPSVTSSANRTAPVPVTFLDRARIKNVGSLVLALLLTINVFAWAQSTFSWNAIHVTSPGVIVQGNIVRLEPEKWIGRSIPLQGLTAQPLPKLKGPVKVLLLSRECDLCRRMLQRTVSGSPTYVSAVVFVDHKRGAPISKGRSEDSELLQMINRIEVYDMFTVFCRVPCVVEIVDGIVVKVEFPDA